MNESTRIVVNGAAGRMGTALSSLIAARNDVSIVAALVRSGSVADGKLADPDPLLRYSSTWSASNPADVLVDFSGTQGFDAALDLACERGIAFVSGSTGLSEPQRAALDRAASEIPVLWAANFSVGVAVLAHLVGRAAQLLPDWDLEIFESHHRHKRDAPSGTALMLGQRATEARRIDPAEAIADRSGPRADGSIGYAVCRGGDVVGEHEVRLLGSGERVELVHRASNRDIFALGALKAACWLPRQPPGSYSMANMLGLDRA